MEASGWENVIGNVALLCLQILALITPVIVPIIVSKVLSYFKLKNNAQAEALMTSLVKKGINWSEAWAKQQTVKPLGQDKMQIAADFVLQAAKNYKLPNIAAEKLIELIEGQLVKDKENVGDNLADTKINREDGVEFTD